MLFGPEEEHGLSGKLDIVPPAPGGDREVYDPFSTFEAQRVVLNDQNHPIVAIATCSADASIPFQHGGDAHCVPNTVSPPRVTTRFHQERSGHSREGIGHQNLAVALLEDENMSLLHSSERGSHLIRLQPKMPGNFGGQRHLPA